MNDNTPPRDWRMLEASSERCHFVSHVYLAAAGIVLALEGWLVITAAFFGMFLFMKITGLSQSITAEVEREYETYRKDIDERQQGPRSWPA
jgi:hypothetical protein